MKEAATETPRPDVSVPMRSRRRRRALRVTADHLYVGGRPFAAFTAKWPEIVSLTITDRNALSQRRDGRSRSINLADLENAAQVRVALVEVQSRLVPPPTAAPIPRNRL